jgi:hypothetical protein
MSKHSRLSREQKRKRKLAARKPVEAVEAYSGRKYQGPEFAQALFQAEVAIHEADRMSDEQMLDAEVLASLEDLVLELRGQASARQDDQPADDVIGLNIKERWRAFFQTRPRHSNSDLAGILRTIMSSVQTRTHMRPGGRGYLEFLRGFLAQAGVRVNKLTAEQADLLEIREVVDSPKLPNVEERGT